MESRHTLLQRILCSNTKLLKSMDEVGKEGSSFQASSTSESGGDI